MVYEEDIVISEYHGTHVFEFVFRFSGLTPKLAGKQVKLYDSSGNFKAVIEAPFMTDANGAYSEDIEVFLEYLDNGT